MQTQAEIESFVIDAGWQGAQRQILQADFSPRRYMRLSRSDKKPSSAILMVAQADQHTEAFVELSSLLRRLEIAAPEIYESDVVRGLVLMEDFGDAQVGKLLDSGEDRDRFDAHAAHLLATLHQKFSQTMLGAYKTPLFNAALLTEQITPFLDYYFPEVFHRPVTARERSVFAQAWHDVLAPLDAMPRSLLLRDFMPDNMMLLKKPVLGQPVGLLDFQDAGLGCIAYDIASWCEQVRRDGGLGRLDSFVKAYVQENPVLEEAELLRAARIYAAQRHIRILGRLVQVNKQDFVPRVWKALQTLLKDPALEPVRRWFLLCHPAGKP